MQETEGDSKAMPISRYLADLRAVIGNRRIMMPAVSAIIVNGAGEVLLHRSKDDGKWYVIGGAPDPGEEPADAAVREALEETGLTVVPERLVGVYADPVVRYPNGDEVLYVAAVFRCRPIGGTARVADDESVEVRYFALDALPPLLTTHRLRIEHAMSGSKSAAFRWKGEWKS
jgi:8-oxo-dGTP pyrophosphatase MutT (NUDIX family)